MALKQNIHEFDELEKELELEKRKKLVQEFKNTPKKLKEWAIRLIIKIDDKLNEQTYKEELDAINKEINMLRIALIVRSRNMKQLYKEKKKLEKRLSKYE